jgi:hypothetical protein
MTDPNPVFERRVVFVIDVQKYLIAGSDAVPDALEVRRAISDILKSVRQHNDLAQLNNASSQKTKIVFVQHDDKDPNDPLHKGKPTWELEFNPRKGDDAEVLVSKDVRESIDNLTKGNVIISPPSKLIETRQVTCSRVTFSSLKNSAFKVSLRSQ